MGNKASRRHWDSVEGRDPSTAGMATGGPAGPHASCGADRCVRGAPPWRRARAGASPLVWVRGGIFIVSPYSQALWKTALITPCCLGCGFDWKGSFSPKVLLTCDLGDTTPARTALPGWNRRRRCGALELCRPRRGQSRVCTVPAPGKAGHPLPVPLLVVGRVTAPRDSHVLTPRTCKCVLWQEGTKVADGRKVLIGWP